MTLIYKQGNILDATENIICHQVNVYGIMGGGLAKQIASRYPNVYEKYYNYCKENFNFYGVLGGESYIVNINENQQIANCFTQLPNFDTDYQAIKDCFTTLLTICKETDKTICIPYKYGCGIANGNWNIVSNIFKKLSNKYGVDITVYKLYEENYEK